MSRKATQAALADLHRKLAEVLTDALEPTTDAETGEAKPPSAAILAQAVAFLKLNNITADADDNPALAALKKATAQKLPFTTQVDEDGNPLVN